MAKSTAGNKGSDKTDFDRSAHAPRTAGGQPRTAKGERPEPGFEEGATPEESNRDHPTAEGLNRTVPGAGIVSADADAPGATRRQDPKPDRRTRDADPGDTGAPQPGPAYGAPEADAASAGPLGESGQEREKEFRRKHGV